MFERIVQNEEDRAESSNFVGALGQSGPQAVVVSPTRELALQTFKVCKSLGKFCSSKICLIVGGESMRQQFQMVESNPDVIIATPGRLVHLLEEIPGFKRKLGSVEYVVFDEADRLFEMGFRDQLDEILKHVSASRQTLLFSATMPKQLMEFAQAGLTDPVVVRLDSETKISTFV